MTLNPDRDERVRQIRERWSRTSFPEQVFTAHVKQDIDCLFSVLDSQVAGDGSEVASKWLSEHRNSVECLLLERDKADLIQQIDGALNDTATRMRDRCVEKVREHAELCRHGYHDARNELLDLIGQLQSLTLEGEQEKSK